MTFILYAIALLIGVILGLLGAGGAIVAVPSLVYLGHIPPPVASGYALFIVAFATLIASVQVIRTQRVHWRAFWSFGSTTMLTIYSIRTFILPSLPLRISLGSLTVNRDWLLMMSFAAVLFAAGYGMLRNRQQQVRDAPPHPARLAVMGIGVGIVVGFLGVGGGFLMTPALVLWARLDIRTAVGTSIALICVNSTVGVAGDVTSGIQYNWPFVLLFTIFTTIGIIIGMRLSHEINAEHLRKLFGWLVMMVGIIVLLMEII